MLLTSLPFRVWMDGWGRAILLTSSIVATISGLIGGVGRGNATYIITWLSHLGFGWRGGEGSVMCDNVLLLLAQRHLCHTMSLSALAPAPKHDATLDVFLAPSWS